MAGDMATLKEHTRTLLERLIDTWDFTLDASQFPNPIHYQYVMKEIRETRKDIVIFGYDTADDGTFNLMFSPKTVAGREYLFFMEVMKTKEDSHIFYFYFFNHRADRISGVFTVWSTREMVIDPDRDTIIADGSFMGFRHPEVT